MAVPVEKAAALALRVEHASKHFGPLAAVENVSLEVSAGAFVALLGPSGCGKTTLMRLIAGFETPDAGRIFIDGEDVTRLPPHQRPVNLMFQSYALFLHMNVRDNIAYGPRRAGLSRTEVLRRVDEMLALTQLAALADRKPHQLSGGQKQRVALARALARKPKLLLLDEPLAALDRKLRDETQFELTRVQRELGTAFVVVTHDQSEAMAMAGRLAIMNAGRIVREGAPAEVYYHPRSRFVAEFLGEINLVAGIITSASDGTVTLNTPHGLLVANVRGVWRETINLGVRPERIEIGNGDSAARENLLHGQVQDFAFRGSETLLRIALDNGAIMRVIAPQVASFAIGMPVSLHIPRDAFVRIDA